MFYKVQRVTLPSGRLTYTVLDQCYVPLAVADTFLSYLDGIQRSPNTVRAYARGLAWFFTFLQERDVSWEDVHLDDIARFVQWLRAPAGNVIVADLTAARVANSTINLYLAAVAVFYEYQARNGCSVAARLTVWRNIARRRYKGFLGHITPRQPLGKRAIRLPAATPAPKTLTLEEVQAVLQACRHKRDLFLFSLLWETGMRVGEALGLRHEDVRTWELAIRVAPRENNLNGVRAKSRSERVVHISRELAHLYSDYMHEEYGLLNSDYVFVNLFDTKHLGHPLTYSNVDQLVRRLRKATGIGYFHAHLFRHTHATDLLKAKVVLEVISRRLGHSSVATTDRIYSHPDTEFLRQELAPFWAARQQEAGA